MKNVKKAFVLLVAILAIVVFTKNVNAAAISTNKTNNTANTANNVTNNATNTAVNNTANEVQPSETPVNNAYQPINSTNSSENIPHTGIEDSYFNFALILLLTLVLGTFSLVQYNKIIKKDQE